MIHDSIVAGCIHTERLQQRAILPFHNPNVKDHLFLSGLVELVAETLWRGDVKLEGMVLPKLQ